AVVQFGQVDLRIQEAAAGQHDADEQDGGQDAFAGGRHGWPPNSRSPKPKSWPRPPRRPGGSLGGGHSDSRRTHFSEGRFSTSTWNSNWLGKRCRSGPVLRMVLGGLTR